MTEGRDWWLLPQGRNQVVHTFHMRSERRRVRVQTRARRRATVARLETQNRANTPGCVQASEVSRVGYLSCLLNVTFDICACGDVMSPARKGAEQGAIKQEQT